MPKFTLVKFLLITFLMGVFGGCRIAVIVVEGGEVQSIGSGTCLAGTICIIEVNDTNFTETFTAVPDDGWYFEKWHSGDGFWCSGLTDPECPVTTVGAEGHKDAEAIIASSEVLYLMPIFKHYPEVSIVEGEPRVIQVDGTKWKWLQPADFIGYSYDEVSAVCPDGLCNGMLPGSTRDLTGYTWASSYEHCLLELAYNNAGLPLTSWFRYTLQFPSVPPLTYETVVGLLRDPPQGPDKLVIVGGLSRDICETGPVPESPIPVSRDDPFLLGGAWFWRPKD